MSTEQKIKEHLKNAKVTGEHEGFGLRIIESFPVGIGQSISIQASRLHYSTPRECRDDGEFTHVEVYVGSTPLEYILQNDGYGVAPYVALKDLADAIDMVYGCGKEKAQ